MKTTTAFFRIVIVLIALMNRANAQYNPPVFQGSSIRPRMGDVSILANSMRAQQDRHSAALNAYKELSEVIANKKKEFPHYTYSLRWFKENVEIYAKRVMDEIEIGNYSNAQVMATKYIGEILSNAELDARIQCYKEYQYYHDGIERRSDLTNEQKEEWKSTYTYKFIPITDSYGKVIGGEPWIEIGGPNYTRVVIPSYQGR